MMMTFFANLRYLHNTFPQKQPGSGSQGMKDQPAGGNIFSESAGLQSPAPLAVHLFYTFPGQQANLPVPAARMGISFNAVIRNKPGPGNGGFGSSLFRADVD
jgi:hypothetical protein